MAFLSDTEISEVPSVNPLQLIAVDALFTVGLVAALKLSGMGWGMALFSGWIGGALITIGVFFALAHFWLLREDAEPRWQPYAATAQAPKASDVNEIKTMWHDDLNEERARWAEHAKNLRIQRSRRIASTQAHVAMWDEDLREDSMKSSA